MATAIGRTRAAGGFRRFSRGLVAAGALSLALAVAASAAALAQGAGSGGSAIDRMLSEPYPLTPGPWSTGAASAPPSRPAPARPAAGVSAAAPGPAEGAYPLGRPWYVAASVGLVIANDADNRGSIDISSNYNNGVVFAGSAGYAWTSGFRIEGQVWYQRFPLDRVFVQDSGNLGLPGGQQPADGDVSTLGLFANAGYDFSTGSPWRPYVIGGTGAVRVNYDDWTAENGLAIADDTDWRLGFQFGGGLAYVFTDRWSAEVGYRFAFTLDPRLRDAAGDSFTGELATHNLLFAARYGF